MVAWPSREELNCWVTLQLAISGSGVLPLPHCFAAVGVPLGVACCVAVALLNDATTQWLLAAAAPLRLGERVARSYSDLAARANFSARTKLAVEASSAILLFGSLAACLATAATEPIDVVRTRIMAQLRASEGKEAKGADFNYRSLADGLAKAARTEGPGALYRGLLPRLVLKSLGGAIWHGSPRPTFFSPGVTEISTGTRPT